MKRLLPYILVLILGGIIGWLLRKPETITKHVTNTVRYTDTVTVIDTLRITSVKYTTDTIHNYHYDTIRYGNTYFAQHFKDTNFNLTTYGGYIDSINLQLYPKTTIITDSIVNTRINTVFKPYKNSIGVLYQYYGNNSISLVYGRNIGRFNFVGSVGWIEKMNKPILGVGVKFNFN